MHNTLLGLFLFVLLLTSCSKKQNPFEIKKQNIGLLTDSTQVKDLNVVFANDSIVKSIGGDEFTGRINDIEIFEKGGKKLLALTPREPLDSTSTIGTVRIFDTRYKTEKGVTIQSVFKEIKKQYKISTINNLINSIVLTIDNLNASFTISKKELPENMRYDMDLKFEETHVPDNAKVKYFFINWNR